MQWYEHEIGKAVEKVILGGIVFLLAILLNVILKPSFVFIDYELINIQLWPKLISALTFMTIGSFVYHAGFYKALYESIGRFCYSLYCVVKAILWLHFMVIVYTVSTAAIWLINFAYSTTFNVINFVQHIIFYTLVSFAIVMAAYCVILLVKIYKT